AASGDDLLQEDLYFYTLDSILSGMGEAFYAAYPFSIRPATDDKPYYTAYVKPATLPAVAADIRELSEEWGYILLVATLGLSAVFGLLIILFPMAGRWRELFAHRRGTLRIIAYYACLGLGYMMIEIFLIQRLTFFLVDPIFSNSVVITSMLILSGLGSLSSGSWRVSGGRRVLIAAIGIGVFCLGIPFPTGLSALSSSRPALIPWAWGVNGALSVTGTVFARLFSISAGYSFVLVAAIVLYAGAAAAFSGNTAGT